MKTLNGASRKTNATERRAHQRRAPLFNRRGRVTPRTLIALALLLAVAFPPLTLVRAQEREQTLKEAQTLSVEDRKASAEEEREARELAVRLVHRLRETDDFDPIVAEFFPADFAERLRQFLLSQPTNSEVFSFYEHAAVSLARADDLRRLYVALLNFWNQQEILGAAAWDYVKIEVATRGGSVAQDQEAWARHYRVQKGAVSAEAYRIASGDPLLELLFKDFISHGINDGEVSEGHADEQKEDATTDPAKFRARYAIRDTARLRVFTEQLERCIPLLRKASEKLRSEMKALAAAHAVPDDPAKYEPTSGDPFRVYHLESEMLKTEAFGLRAGTLVIKARIRPYEMALARLDGRLTILAVYPYFDND